MVHGNWPKNDLAQLVLHGRAANQDIVNVFSFEVDDVQQALHTSDAAAQAAFDSLIDDWRTNVMPAWLNCVSSVYTLPRVSVQVVERSGQFEHRLAPTERTYTTAITGAGNASVSSLAAAGVIRWKSTVAGKKHRGRTYVPCIAESDAEGGLLSGALQAAYATFADLMLARYAAGGGGTFPHFSHTVYSRPYSAPKGAYAKRVGGVLTVVNDTTNYDGDSTNITSRQIDPTIRQQRRREIGVGS